MHYHHAVVSYYAGHFVGRRTASGEIYNPHKSTCAGPPAWRGKVLLLTSHDAQGRVWKANCFVNDLGPAVRGRALDLTPFVFEHLGASLRAGLLTVEIEEVAEAPERKKR